MTGPTIDEQERLVTRILHPSPITEVCSWLAIALYSTAERWAGVGDDYYDRATIATWPPHARVADWLGDRVDALGIWANRRKTARRLRRRAMDAHPAGRADG